jgi:hypothetical protein
MQATQRNLAFWRMRMRTGGNHLFMLLSQGPIAFARDALSLVRLAPPKGSASDRIEEKVGQQPCQHPGKRWLCVRPCSFTAASLSLPSQAELRQRMPMLGTPPPPRPSLLCPRSCLHCSA